ncbi:MAG: alkaline phosphatase PafA, partial [Flavisolibacter sp.]
MRTFYLSCLLIFTCCISEAQKLQRPKLVIGIVIDQMRWDYLYRFYDRYSQHGFKRILNGGFNCENTLIPYTHTQTAAGHACIYSGSVPALNGILANSWYDRSLNREVYCTEDATVQTIGSVSTAGRMSPRNLWSTTITDELKVASNFRNKTISIALKDRSSILPGGHSADAAYWFDNASGGWISSSYYMKDLPEWVKKFNDRNLPDAYLKKGWNTLYPIKTYIQSTPDSNRYEGRLPGEDSWFPHRTDTITRNRHEAFKYTPQADLYTFDMARAAIEEEKLGQLKDITDFLALSFSSPDYIGHAFGPNSIEIEDTYLRLDLALADFLKYLDGRLGKNNYLLFLTADHAVAHNPFFMQDHKLPAGSLEYNDVRRKLNDTLEKKFRVNGILSRWSNYMLYLNDSLIDKAGLNKNEIKSFLTGFLMKQPAVANIVDLENLAGVTLPERLKTMLTNGYNQKLSGDLQILLKPGYFQTMYPGATHGQWPPFDAHIPLLWYGWKVSPGKTNREIHMTDIAPTLAA